MSWAHHDRGLDVIHLLMSIRLSCLHQFTGYISYEGDHAVT